MRRDARWLNQTDFLLPVFVAMIIITESSSFSIGLATKGFHPAARIEKQQQSLGPSALSLVKLRPTYTTENSEEDSDSHGFQQSDDLEACHPSTQRRNLLVSALIGPAVFGYHVEKSDAALPGFGRQSSQPSSLYALSPQRNTTTIRTPMLDSQLPTAFDDELSSELCLLRLLPIKNPFFRELQATIEGLSALRVGDSSSAWAAAAHTVQTKGVAELDRKRSLLEPVFNPDEDTLMQISKGERFEVLIETLRTRLVDIADAAAKVNATETFAQQKKALITLSDIGELLVTKFPYAVPTEGQYSYLPRLLGRCKITFTFRRRKTILGQMTLVADGYAAPITAGNFVDLCARDFYTGLPIKFAKKRLGSTSGSDFEVANLPVLGSFNDGFYDPLTAKLRRLPLELIRVGKGSGIPELTYSQGLSILNEKLLEPTVNSRPLLSFKIPGLVAMNHPDKNPNGASSEFFGLQKDSMLDDKKSLLDGEYAPFGYVIEGYELFQKLQPNDVIEETNVSEFGILNLVKLRRSSFSEVVQGSGESKNEDKP